jgi:hypothetical protein
VGVVVVLTGPVLVRVVIALAQEHQVAGQVQNQNQALFLELHTPLQLEEVAQALPTLLLKEHLVQILYFLLLHLLAVAVVRLDQT